jgi:hypothetical protein
MNWHRSSAGMMAIVARHLRYCMREDVARHLHGGIRLSEEQE